MLFHLFLLVLIIFTLFFFYTDVMNKINTNKPFAEGMENADTGDTTNNVDDSAPNNLGDKVTYEVLTDLKAFCADGDNKTTKMIWNGEICEGDKIKWNSMKSLAGTTRSDQPDGCEWKRSDYETDRPDWIENYVGNCGVSPAVISLPVTLEEVKSKGGIVNSSSLEEATDTKPIVAAKEESDTKSDSKCVTVSELNSAANWVDHLFGTLSNTKCADKEKVLAAKTASKTDFISGMIKGYENDKEGSNKYYMEAINKATPMLNAAFSGSTNSNNDSIKNNVTATMNSGSTNDLEQNGSVPKVNTETEQLVQTPAYQQAMNQIHKKNNNYQMANGNLMTGATGNCPNGCRPPNYDNEKCSNQIIEGKAYRNCPWLGDGSINDSMCKDCGSVLLPKNKYGYARTRPGLFNKNTINNLLISKQFNEEPENPNIDYTNIGLKFMTELSMARDFTLPYISSEKYKAIGKIVNKYQLDETNDNKKELVDIINGALNMENIPSSSGMGNMPDTLTKNSEHFNLQKTLNKREKTDLTSNSKDSTEQTESMVKGLMGSDKYYKATSSSITEAKNDNRLGGSKTLFSGYTTNYRPRDPRKKPNPYDSIWELFKQ